MSADRVAASGSSPTGHTLECLEASRVADLAWDEYMLAARARWPYDDPELRHDFAVKEHELDDAKERCGCG